MASITRLNRHDQDNIWRELARNAGVTEDVARVLWARAQADITDPVKAEQAFVRMLAESKAASALAAELAGDSAADKPDIGKWTRVLVEEQAQASAGGASGEARAQTPAQRLAQALMLAVQSGESAAKAIASSDARTVTESLRRFQGGQIGQALALIDNGAISQIIKLADSLVSLVSQDNKPVGKALPAGLRGDLEQRLGVDFGDVRVHDHADAASEASRHGAVAFARGTNVYFADGAYDPSSHAGKALIAHELAHVAQQRKGGGTASSGAMSTPGDSVEREADRVAHAFASGQAANNNAFQIRERASAGTISRATPGQADAAASGSAAPKDWKPTILGQVLDLSSKLADAKDADDGVSKQIDINQQVGPIKIIKATFKTTGDKVDSGTLYAVIEDGTFKGVNGTLTVDGTAHVSGKLEIPLDVPNLMAKHITVEVGNDKISGTVLLDPKDITPPGFPIQASAMTLVVTSDKTSGVSASLTGSATVTVENGLANGTAKMDVDLKADRSGVSFAAHVEGKIAITGLVDDMTATIDYDGKTVTMQAGGTVPVHLPGLEGSADIKYENGALEVHSENLKFTLPQLQKIKWDEVTASKSKLQGKFHLAEPITQKFGEAEFSLDESSVAIDGGVVGGDLSGSFTYKDLKASAKVSYQKGGDFTGKVTLDGGGKFTVAGVEVEIASGSHLDIAKGLGVTGEMSATIKMPAPIPVINAKIGKTTEGIDVTVDTHIPLDAVSGKQLGGDLHVVYNHAAGGGNAFTLDATEVKVAAAPVSGQVLFSQLKAELKGKEITGTLTAKAGTHLKAGDKPNSPSVTILGGTIELLEHGVLNGHVQASVGVGESAGTATVGWKDGKFDWAAEADFDLGGITDHMLNGTVHAAGGSDGSGSFVSNGKITFGNPALQGIVIEHLSGNKETKHFTATIDAHEAVNRLAAKIDAVDLNTTTGKATVTYDGTGFKFDTQIDGTAKYPKGGESKLEGKFHLKYDNTDGFEGTLSEVKITASEYFQLKNGTADLKTGIVDIKSATFKIPEIATGDVTGTINIKEKTFDLASNIHATSKALEGLEVAVTLKNDVLEAKLAANSPPIQIGDFATAKVGEGSTVKLEKGAGFSTHLVGLVEAKNLGNGKFTLDYSKTAGLTGDADIHIEPFAMFDAVEVGLTIDRNRHVSTKAPIVVKLAPAYTSQFEAEAHVNVTDNKFDVSGHVKEVKNLGKISDAFKRGGGAEIKYANKQVTMGANFEIGPEIPEVAGSTLTFGYRDKKVDIKGNLKPKQYGPIVFKSDSDIQVHWATGEPFTVTGHAAASINDLCDIELDVDAASSKGGEPGQFTLKGKIDPTALAQKFQGVTFSSVKADFAVKIGGGEKSDLDFHARAEISAIKAANINEVDAYIDVHYKTGAGLDGEVGITKVKIGQVIGDGKIVVTNGKFASGELHIVADIPAVTIEGKATVQPGEVGGLDTTADLKVTPSNTSAISKFIQDGNIHVELKKWHLTKAEGTLNLVPPSFLPLLNPVIKVGYEEGPGMHAELATDFPAPMAKNGELGHFEVGYSQGEGLHATITFPLTVPGFQKCDVSGKLDQKGIEIEARLTPKDASIVKEATIKAGYEMGGAGFFIEGSILLHVSDSLELTVGLRFDGKGLSIIGLTSNDKEATSQDHEIANFHKDFPKIPLATIGVASLNLEFGMGVAAGYRMPKIKFKNPQIVGGLDALDQGGLPEITFGGSIAMGAYIELSLSVQVVGEIQLLIASADAGIGAEIAARLDLELGADVDGRFAPGKGAQLQIDPSVHASLDLIARLIATLHAEICWFTIIDKKWTLASANLAHIELGTFHPFQPVGLQLGGPEGTHLTNGLHLRDDAFDQINEGVKKGASHASDEEANRDAREHVKPVLDSFKNASHQFENLPEGWQNGMTVAPVNFDAMFPGIDSKAWDYYQDHADTAETVYPEGACTTPVQKLAKAVAIMAKKNPFAAGNIILGWRRAQIAHMGVDPDTGTNVVLQREEVQGLIDAKYAADLLEAQNKQKAQDDEHKAHVIKQGQDFTKAETEHVKKGQEQVAVHKQNTVKTQATVKAADKELATSAQHAKTEGAKVAPKVDETVKAPPPTPPPAPPLPKPLAKPAPIPVLPPVPLPVKPAPLPAVTLPALPADPGVNVSAGGAIPASKGAPKVESPGKATPKGGASPDPSPGQTSVAKQAGGGGGQAMPGGTSNGGGKGGAPAGGGGGAASVGPAVAAGPAGVVSQEHSLDAKKAELTGKPSAPAKPGAAPAPAAAKAPAPPAGAAPGAAPGGAAKPGAPAAPGAPGAAGAAGAAGKDAKAGGAPLDPTVAKVAEAGKAEEAQHKATLANQDKQFQAQADKKATATKTEAKKLDQTADQAKKAKEKAAADAAAAAKADATKKADAGKAAGPGAKGPDGKPAKKDDKPIGTRVDVNALGESHTMFIDPAGQPMVEPPLGPLAAKVTELAGAINAAPGDVKKQGGPSVSPTQTLLTTLTQTAGKAAGGDESAKTAVAGAQTQLGAALKITWAWAKVAADPAVTNGSIEDPLKHPYYPTFKGRVQTLSAEGHISVEVTQYAEGIWTKICKAVKAANPMMTDPQAYSNFAKGWLNMKSPEFLKAIAEFDAIGKEMAKAGSAGFAKAKNFGFWSKDEGRALAESISDLTLETSAIGGLMDGLPTLDGKKAGWDPEIWGALSNAYAQAVVPEILKGKKVNVCVGAGVAAGNIWEAVESEALAKGLKGTKLTLEGVCTNYAAAAKTQENRKQLDDSKLVGGHKGCVFVGARAGAIAAAEAHWKTLPAPGAPPVADPKAPKTDDKAVSKHAAGPAPSGWEGNVVGKIDSTKINSDDPGHTYHILKDGSGVSTTEPKKLDDASTKKAIDTVKPPALITLDPIATLESPEYKDNFLPRYKKMFAELKMPVAEEDAKNLWLKVVEVLTKTNDAYKAAPLAPGSTYRKDLTADAFKKIMVEFDPIIAALTPAMEKFTAGKKIWAFWSGDVACDVAKANSEVCLEKSALGNMLDGLDINGGWNIQMWASLSKAYATHAAKDAESKQYRGFVGSRSSEDASIFNKIEQPQFVNMLDQKVAAKISTATKWYAVAENPKTPRTLDPTVSADGITGVYAVGDRAGMIKMAEDLNPKRIKLYTLTQKFVPKDSVAAEFEKHKAELEAPKADPAKADAAKTDPAKIDAKAKANPNDPTAKAVDPSKPTVAKTEAPKTDPAAPKTDAKAPAPAPTGAKDPAKGPPPKDPKVPPPIPEAAKKPEDEQHLEDMIDGDMGGMKGDNFLGATVGTLPTLVNHLGALHYGLETTYAPTVAKYPKNAKLVAAKTFLKEKEHNVDDAVRLAMGDIAPKMTASPKCDPATYHKLEEAQKTVDERWRKVLAKEGATYAVGISICTTTLDAIVKAKDQIIKDRDVALAAAKQAIEGVKATDPKAADLLKAEVAKVQVWLDEVMIPSTLSSPVRVAKLLKDKEIEDAKKKPQAADPAAKKVEPGKPADPNAKPANAKADPNAKPADPNAKKEDPSKKAEDPTAKAVDPKAPKAPGDPKSQAQIDAEKAKHIAEEEQKEKVREQLVHKMKEQLDLKCEQSLHGLEVGNALVSGGLTIASMVSFFNPAAALTIMGFKVAIGVGVKWSRTRDRVKSAKILETLDDANLAILEGLFNGDTLNFEQCVNILSAEAKSQAAAAPSGAGKATKEVAGKEAAPLGAEGVEAKLALSTHAAEEVAHHATEEAAKEVAEHTAQMLHFAEIGAGLVGVALAARGWYKNVHEQKELKGKISKAELDLLDAREKLAELKATPATPAAKPTPPAAPAASVQLPAGTPDSFAPSVKLPVAKKGPPPIPAAALKKPALPTAKKDPTTAPSKATDAKDAKTDGGTGKQPANANAAPTTPAKDPTKPPPIPKDAKPTATTPPAKDGPKPPPLPKTVDPKAAAADPKAADPMAAEKAAADAKTQAKDPKNADPKAKNPEPEAEVKFEPIVTTGSMMGTPHTLTITETEVILASDPKPIETVVGDAEKNVADAIDELDPNSKKGATPANAKKELAAINAHYKKIKAMIAKIPKKKTDRPKNYKEEKGSTANVNLGPLAKELMALSREIMDAINLYGSLFDVHELDAPIRGRYPSPDVGTHPVESTSKLVGPDNLARESHHVPNNELFQTLREELDEVGAQLAANKSKTGFAKNSGFRAMGDAMVDAATKLQKVHGAGGKNLSAILTHRVTHQNINQKVGTAVHSKGMANLITKAVELEEAELKVKYERIGVDKIPVKPTNAQWGPFVQRCKTAAAKAKSDKEKKAAAKDLELVKKVQAEIKGVTKEQKAALERIATSKIQPMMQTAFESALGQTYTAIKTAVELSRVDGPESEKQTRLTKLLSEAHRTWAPIVKPEFKFNEPEMDDDFAKVDES